MKYPFNKIISVLSRLLFSKSGAYNWVDLAAHNNTMFCSICQTADYLSKMDVAEEKWQKTKDQVPANFLKNPINYTIAQYLINHNKYDYLVRYIEDLLNETSPRTVNIIAISQALLCMKECSVPILNNVEYPRLCEKALPIIKAIILSSDINSFRKHDLSIWGYFFALENNKEIAYYLAQKLSFVNMPLESEGPYLSLLLFLGDKSLFQKWFDYLINFRGQELLLRQDVVEKSMAFFVKDAIEFGMEESVIFNKLLKLDNQCKFPCNLLFLLGDVLYKKAKYESAFTCYLYCYREHRLPDKKIPALVFCAIWCDAVDLIKRWVQQDVFHPFNLFLDVARIGLEKGEMPSVTTYLAACTVDAFDQGYKIDDNSLENVLMSAFAYYVSNKINGVIKITNAFIRRYPEKQWLFRTRLMARICMMQSGASREDFLDPLSWDDASVSADEHFMRTVYCLLRGDFNRLEEALQMLYDISPDFTLDISKTPNKAFWFIFLFRLAGKHEHEKKCYETAKQIVKMFDYIYSVINNELPFPKTRGVITMPAFKLSE